MLLQLPSHQFRVYRMAIPGNPISAESSCVTSTPFSRNPELYSPADDFLPKPASAEEITRGLAALLNR